MSARRIFSLSGSGIHSQILQQALKDLDRAYRNFYEKRAGFPKFRKKGWNDAFRFPQGVTLDEPNARSGSPRSDGSATTRAGLFSARSRMSLSGGRETGGLFRSRRNGRSRFRFILTPGSWGSISAWPASPPSPMER